MIVPRCAGRLIFLCLALPAGCPLAAATATLPRGPYLQLLLDRSVEVIWTTDIISRAEVVFTPEGGAAQSKDEGVDAVEHRVRLEALQPGTRYTYEIREVGQRLAGPFQFRTAPPTGEGAIRVAALGDSGWPGLQQGLVAERVEEFGPDLFLHLGDMDYVGDVDLMVFEAYRRIMAEACIYPAMGNHDGNWGQLFTAPSENPEKTGTYYSFDWGPAHFICLDTNQQWINLCTPETQAGPQLAWLEADLEAARSAGRAPWIVVYFHKPLHTIGGYADVGDRLCRRKWLGPLFDRFEVDLVLSGHDHNYERTYPVRADAPHDIWQEPAYVLPRGAVEVVSGGGGAPLYQGGKGDDRPYIAQYVEAHHFFELEISAERLRGRAITKDHEVIDDFTIRKEGARPELDFVRGDVDRSGALDLTDAILILAHLFGGVLLECPLWGDVDASGGALELADPVVLLAHLFLAGPPPRPPYPGCGRAAAEDDAWCRASNCR